MYKLFEHSSKVLRVNCTNKSSRWQWCYGIMAMIVGHNSPITACATAWPGYHVHSCTMSNQLERNEGEP